MTHRATSSHTPLRRTLATLAAAASLAVIASIGVACMDPGEEDGEFLASVDCSKVPTWKPGLQIKGVNDQVQLGGKVFASLIGAYTVVNDQSWAPPTATLWRSVAQCGGTAQPPVTPPPVVVTPPPPATTPPPPKPPTGAPNGSLQCVFKGANAGLPGPKFDVQNGGKNVGNGKGGQFITGQCLSNADCASGCCALPCGICSGPGAQFQAGKQGCGFVGNTPATL